MNLLYAVRNVSSFELAAHPFVRFEMRLFEVLNEKSSICGDSAFLPTV